MILKMEKLKIKRKDVIELLKNEAIPDLEPMNICETMIKNEIISEERGYKNTIKQGVSPSKWKSFCQKR